MAIVKSAFATILAVIATFAAVAIAGLIQTMLFVVVISVIAMLQNAAEAERTGEPKPLMTTEHAAFATVVAVIASWLLIVQYGPRGGNGIFLFLVSTIVIVASAVILDALLRRVPSRSAAGR